MQIASVMTCLRPAYSCDESYTALLCVVSYVPSSFDKGKPTYSSSLNSFHLSGIDYHLCPTFLEPFFLRSPLLAVVRLLLSHR